MITKAALLLFRSINNQKELMFVHAQNQSFYVFPGGKQEQGETIEQALTREIREELSANISNVEKLGVVAGQTPDGRELTMYLFGATLNNVPKASSEINEIAWMSKAEVIKNKEKMMPMTLNHVMPYLDAHNLW